MGDTAAAARSAFPSGLVQPESGFRFGLDSLLLACFASCRPGCRVVDLGTGCGVIGLGLCLANPCSRPRVLGVDVQAGMVEAATENARRLGLADLYAARKGDVRQYRKIPGMGPESFDLVLANPPYRLMGQGRPPRDEGKRGACFEYRARLKDFLQAAAFALTNKGRISLVYMVERLPALLHELHECRLEPKEMRLVHAAEHKPAGLALLTARKNVRPGLAVHSPLFLDRPKELEAFCPLVAGAEEAGGGRLAIG